jgi:hypothetical protein
MIKKLKKSAVSVLVFFLLIWIVSSPNVDFLRFQQNLSVIDIKSARIQPRSDGGNIFFLETREPVQKTANLTRRQACAIESAGKL